MTRAIDIPALQSWCGRGERVPETARPDLELKVLNVLVAHNSDDGRAVLFASFFGDGFRAILILFGRDKAPG